MHVSPLWKKIFHQWTRPYYSLVGVSLGFYMVMALVPTAYLLVILLYRIPNWQQAISLFLQVTLPVPLANNLISYITAIHPRLQWIDITLLAVSLWQISQGAKALGNLLNQIYHYPIYRWWQAIAFSMIATIVGILLMALLLALMVVFPSLSKVLQTIFALPTYFLVLLGVMLLIYKFLPNHPMRFRAVLPGSIFAASVISLILTFFGIYVAYSHFENLYGPITWLVILLILCQFIAMTLVFGAIVNVEYFNRTRES